jgi:nucleotide-binding universal stress UspA family protein
MRHSSELEEQGELLERWSASLARSRERRAAKRRPPRRITGIRAVAATLGAIAAGAGVAALDNARTERLLSQVDADTAFADRRPHPEHEVERPPTPPAPAALRRAERYARHRDGLVSFAAVDDRGRIDGSHLDRPYVSASVVKALLLAAELRRLEGAEAPLDPATGELLTAMVTYSDNDAADTIYARVGDAGLYEVARRTGMRSFTVSGYWANAQITARDIAGFMWRLDRALPPDKRRFARSTLAAVVPQQRWGIPETAGRHWRLRFKGGWRSTERGQLVHQAAALRHDRGSRAAVAVLTDGQPSHGYGIETVRGVAERLLADPEPRRPGSNR